ncbi:MAG: hypothetical protein O3A02_03950 [bacterium]|nr:hypothetical protein [bacterium]
MLRHTWRFAAVSLVALLLAACSITVVPWVPPASTADLTAEVYDPLGNDAPATQYSGQVGANEALYFDLSVPTARDLLYAEVIGTDVRVSLQTTAGSILSVSNSPRYFASSISALAAPAELAPANISTSFFCDGPCAAIRPQGTSYLIAVRNLGAVPRPF